MESVYKLLWAINMK